VKHGTRAIFAGGAVLAIASYALWPRTDGASGRPAVPETVSAPVGADAPAVDLLPATAPRGAEPASGADSTGRHPAPTSSSTPGAQGAAAESGVPFDPSPEAERGREWAQALGWEAGEVDPAQLDQRLARHAARLRDLERAGFDPAGRDRARLHNAAVEEFRAELVTAYGSGRAGQLVDRLRLYRLDPETGDQLRIDVHGNVLERWAVRD
jgi:hypothetical protein